MAKKNVTYQISMDKIRAAGERGKRTSHLPDFRKLLDGDYRAYALRRALIYLLLAAFVTAFLLLLSASTSPLYNDYCDGDSSIFMVIGKGITQGKHAYTDLFDHKGPILFYLNALGFLMTGSKTGVFIVQCVFLSLTAIYMYKTARIFTKTIRSLICVALTILAFASTISDGNLSEEYCMLFCVIAIYFAVKSYALSPKEAHPPLYSAVYGVCFALCAFIRINNGVMIGGIVLVVLMNEFVNGRLGSAVLNLCSLIAGMAVVTSALFTIAAIEDNLQEMIFGTFTFNFMYAAEGAEQTASFIGELVRWTMPLAALVVITVLFSKRLGTQMAALITTLSVFALIPALMGFSYTHYYTTLIPLISLYCAVFFFIATRRITFWSVLLCAVMAFPLSGYFISLPDNVKIYTNKLQRQSDPASYSDLHSDIYESANQLGALIPEADKDSVFGYKVEAAWFLQADITPCFRLFTLQESWADHYPEFGKEINQMMIDNPPKWLVIRNIENIGSRQFVNIVNDKYELQSEFGYYGLYEINDWYEE